MIPDLYIGDLRVPVGIVQGGMSVGISLSGLSAAVATEGGVGVIGSAGIGMLEPEGPYSYAERNNRALRREIRNARRISSGAGLIGVNIMVALSNFEELAKTAIEEKADVIFAGAGLPLRLPALSRRGMHTKLVPIVSSARAAGIIAKRWSDKYDYVPDAFVIEGPMAGGHLGFSEDQINDPRYRLEALLPPLVKFASELGQHRNRKIPVIAAGGIYTGEDIYRYIKHGASAVQMATRFVTTYECDASLEFKEAYIHSTEKDIRIIKSPVGLPGRVLTNTFVHEVTNGRTKPFKCPYHCIITCRVKESPFCIASALLNAKNGDMRNGFAFCGANAYRAKEIVSVRSLMETLQSEYQFAELSEVAAA